MHEGREEGKLEQDAGMDRNERVQVGAGRDRSKRQRTHDHESEWWAEAGLGVKLAEQN